jgi:hypothetical protein
MLQLVELTLGPARVWDIAEQAEQLIERVAARTQSISSVV